MDISKRDKIIFKNGVMNKTVRTERNLVEKTITKFLQKHKHTLEKYFKQAVTFEFIVEQGRLFITDARPARNNEHIANIRIALSMFAEGIISLEQSIANVRLYSLYCLRDEYTILNEDELSLLCVGLPASSGVAAGEIVFSDTAPSEREGPYLALLVEVNNSRDYEIVRSSCGVITTRGGMTSHAAAFCRKYGMPCVVGIDYDIGSLRREFATQKKTFASIDGATGKVYIGKAVTKRSDFPLEVETLRDMVNAAIRCDLFLENTVGHTWRIRDHIATGIVKDDHRYTKKMSVLSTSNNYTSFKQPPQEELDAIFANLHVVESQDHATIIEDLVDFLLNQFSEIVQTGEHYKYFRPLLDPHKSFTSDGKSMFQITGLEFFNVNKYLENYLEFFSIKLYFAVEISTANDEDEPTPMNFLDFSNPNGESLTITNYRVFGFELIVNDEAVVEQSLLSQFYHVFRKRSLGWNWYEENEISRYDIIRYLLNSKYSGADRVHGLCAEKGLISGSQLTKAGQSLIGDCRNEEGSQLSSDGRIDYIIEAIQKRGSDARDKTHNDFLDLLRRKEFKDLIVLELYEVYFYRDRHEYDLQILKEIVESVGAHLFSRDNCTALKNGLLMTLPSLFLMKLLASIGSRLKKVKDKSKQSPWGKMEANVNKLDSAFGSHDYILTEDIKNIFGATNDEILPLLKLFGCKCYYHAQKSIWIKPGVDDNRVIEILKNQGFREDDSSRVNLTKSKKRNERKKPKRNKR